MQSRLVLTVIRVIQKIYLDIFIEAISNINYIEKICTSNICKLFSDTRYIHQNICPCDTQYSSDLSRLGV